MGDDGDFMKSIKQADQQDRMGFVKKVYSILFVQLLISGICIGLTISNENVCLWMIDNWWATAVETFNFASTNWGQFSGAVDAVRQILIIFG